MKRSVWQWLVISSVLAPLGALAATRPQYGGTLRISLHAAPSSLDTASNGSEDSVALRNVKALIFQELVTVDAAGVSHPELASAWQSASGNRRWTFQLRRNVKFDDDTPLTAEVVAASLRTANAAWRVAAEGDRVVIQTDSPDSDLPAELAQSRYAIIKKNEAGSLSGTGPFLITQWQPGRKLLLAANENCWQGRPYLDGIDIEFGRNTHDQQLALESGRTDLADVPAEQVHRVMLEGQRVISSQPIELLALVFSTEAQSQEEKALRDALGLSIERSSIHNVLLQDTGQASGGILPTWISGYGFVFPADADLTRARELRGQFNSISHWTINYDITDPVARLVAERVALNAGDAGLSVQVGTNSSADIKVVRFALADDPRVALANFAAFAGLPTPSFTSGSAEDLYQAESAMLATRKVIPLFHLPISYACASDLQNCTVSPSGDWNLADVSIARPKP